MTTQTQSEKSCNLDCIKILRAVNKFRFLTINQLRANLEIRSYLLAKNTLFKLWRNGYLERLVLTRASRRISYCYVFALNRRGARELTISRGLERVFYLKANAKRSTIFLEHTILINNFRISLECLERKSRDFQLISWRQHRREVKINLK